MAYTKRIRLLRKTAFRVLSRLAKNGCGDGGWCECLLCRVMRVVRTEQFRNTPAYKSSWAGYETNPATQKTRMINWRGGQIEFATSSEYDAVANSPWYAILLLRKGQKDKDGWIYWLDYAGPPQLYLTRTAATKQAKALRKQYTRPPHYEGSYRKVKVIKIGRI
ncbi:hypothetical protein LCGC14_0404090 [marine sediment metagenome]|uniref:Uncharacterized protein n=1 Tax=marine sediment metagenome TaxID=412755 RepID=A0A0F9SVY0_9ZZZZ